MAGFVRYLLHSNGIRHYLHIATGEKRKQLLSDRMTGIITQQQFELEQKKMRGGKYLKYIYTEAEMENAIKEA